MKKVFLVYESNGYDFTINHCVCSTRERAEQEVEMLKKCGASYYKLEIEEVFFLD